MFGHNDLATFLYQKGARTSCDKRCIKCRMQVSARALRALHGPPVMLLQQRKLIKRRLDNMA